MKFENSTIAIALAAGISGAATAGIPVMSLTVAGSNGGNGVASLSVAPVADSPHQYRFTGMPIIATGVYSAFTLYAMDSAAAGRQSFGGQITVINSSTSMQTFTIDISANTQVSGSSSMLTGSMSGALMDQNGNGASFTTGVGTPGWSGLLGSTVAATMFSTPGSVTAQPFLTAPITAQSFGIPTAISSAVPVGSNVGIRLSFQLSAGDRVDLTTVFVVVPAPGAFAFIAAAGIVGTPRRRRA